MQHITFARFPDHDSAMGAVQRIQQRIRAGAGNDAVLVHTGARNAADFEQQAQHSPTFESDQRHALVLGTVVGCASGAVCGLLLAGIGILPAGLGLGAAFGALMGVLVGIVMMSVFGAGLLDRRLQRLTRDLRAGEVVVTVRTADRQTTDQVVRLLEEAGAEVAAKSPV